MESILKRYVVVKAAQALAEIVELLRRVNNVIVEKHSQNSWRERRSRRPA